MLPIYFAPLQGYTEDAYRRLHHSNIGGVDAYFTPFVRWEHGGVRSKDMRDIRREFNSGVPLVPQVIASSAKELQSLLDVLLPLDYKHIDINMGCPFPLQTRHGRGAGILQHPEAVKEICKIIKEHPQIEFSVKTRLGLESNDEWKQILPILNDTPLRFITLHPRIATQQYKGTVDMEAFKEFLNASTHPVIYNGDISSIEDIQNIEKQYNVAGIMIGRGLLARPTLAQEYKTGSTIDDKTLLRIIKDIHSKLLEHYTNIIPNESQQLAKIRTYWDFMEETIGRKQWKKIIKAGNMKNYLIAVNSL